MKRIIRLSRRFGVNMEAERSPIFMSVGVVVFMGGWEKEYAIWFRPFKWWSWGGHSCVVDGFRARGFHLGPLHLTSEEE